MLSWISLGTDEMSLKKLKLIQNPVTNLTKQGLIKQV